MNKIKGYDLVNTQKLDRALNGEQQGSSERVGGVGNGVYWEKGAWMKEGEIISDKEVAALETALLAEYDRLGGLIRLDGDKVKTGCFYNFKGRKPFETPDVKLEFMINGKKVEVDADKPLPPLVEAARKLRDEEEDEPVDNSVDTGEIKRGRGRPRA